MTEKSKSRIYVTPFSHLDLEGDVWAADTLGFDTWPEVLEAEQNGKFGRFYMVHDEKGYVFINNGPYMSPSIKIPSSR